MLTAHERIRVIALSKAIDPKYAMDLTFDDTGGAMLRLFEPQSGGSLRIHLRVKADGRDYGFLGAYSLLTLREGKALDAELRAAAAPIIEAFMNGAPRSILA